MSQSSNRPRRRVVLITGASTGLGLAVARELLKEPDRYHLILTARGASLSRFKEAGIRPSDHLWIRELDVLSHQQRIAVVREANEVLGGVDVLINNAGYMLRAVVEHVGQVERFKQIDTNFRAPMALIREVLPMMRQKRSGHIINISSVGGMMAMPTMSVYSASKFALEGASEALWYEVRPWKIRVTLVQPGFIRSRSYLNVKHTPESQRSMDDPEDPYFPHYNSMVPFIDKWMGRSRATTEKVAKKIARLMKRKHPPLRVAGTPDARLFGWLRRLLPSWLYHNVLYFMLPKVLRWGK